MSGTDETAPASPVEAQFTVGPDASEEFFIRVNDIIQSANRIERRLDTHHAEMVMLHAFSRYSAHHYRTHVKNDDMEGRLAFAAYISRGVEELIVKHLTHMQGPPAAAAPEAEPSAE